MFLLSALHARPDPSLRDAIRREVQQELQHSARLDRDAWLKLARAAPRDELVRALEEKMERYHALRDGVAEDDPLRTDIDVILGRASSALRLARQAPETASAEAVLARHAAEAAAALRVAATPPVPAPEPATPLPAEPAAAAAPGVAPPAEAAPEPASPAPPDETHPPARGPRPADVTRPPLGRPDDSLQAAPPGSSAFEGQAQIEHLLMEGEVRMTVADYANAVKVYDKLVKIAPKVAAFHLRLAVAMACYPRTSKLAEREFYEAARLEPENAEIHYQWGLYYKVMKIKSRAIAEMRTAVRLSPKHKAARAELESMSPKDSALTSLKKLFR
jgi:tetratricopeptide (TPR) repeat protein